MAISELSLQGQVVDQSRYSAGAGVYFSSDLNLRTEEGDVVNLSFDTEQSAHLRLVAAMRAGGIYFTHVPNGGTRGRRAGGGVGMGIREGVRKGFPDFLIFDPTDNATFLSTDFGRWRGTPVGRHGVRVGLALELKRPGATWRSVTQEQREALEELFHRGWVVVVGFGYDDAASKLLRLGYRLPTFEGPVPWTTSRAWPKCGFTQCPFCEGTEVLHRRGEEARTIVGDAEVDFVFACSTCCRSWDARTRSTRVTLRSAT